MSDINKIKKECKILPIAVFFMAAAEIAMGIFDLVMGASESGNYLAGGCLESRGAYAFWGMRF